MSWDWMERLLAASVDLAVLAALVWGGARLLRLKSPRVVALLWLLVMIRPLIGLAVGPPILLDLPAVTVAPAVEQQEVEIRRPGAGGPVVETSETVSPSAASWAGWLWTAGLAALVLAAGVDRLRLRRLLDGTEPAPPGLRQRLSEVARRLGIQRELPELRVTRDLESPALAGTWRPTILVPAWLADGDPERLDWALGHELMHWKAKDHLSAALRQLFQTVFFFHPVAWWVGRRWEEAAELACDRALVRNEDEAASYAERLYEMLAQARGRRRLSVAGGLFATRTQIGRRIAALLHGPVSGPARLSALSLAALGVLAILSLSVGTGCRAHRTGNIRADLEISGPEGRFKLDAQGRFALARNHEDVQSLTPGSRMTLQQNGEETVRLEITAGPGGEIRRVYSVNGKERPYDWEGRVWMAKTLPRLRALPRTPGPSPPLDPSLEKDGKPCSTHASLLKL